jgi:peroxiredoxin
MTIVLLYLIVALTIFASISPLRATTYYIDCENGDDANTGTSTFEPWGSLARVNDHSFLPGDTILLKRGTRCSGVLTPSGSGSQGTPIRIGAYGNGTLPIIKGTDGSSAVVKLFNQQYWHIESIEVVGGDPFGIHISGDKGTLRHFRLRDVLVRDTKGKVDTKRSGLIAVVAGAPGQTFKDVIIDGATCHSTTQWAGIVVDGGATSYWEGTPIRAEDVTVRNSVVHDVYGDGIILFRVRNGLIEKNVSWNTGMQHTQDVGTPNSMWTWTCDNCIVQFNEGFFADSPGVDAGVFDIDWGCTDNIIQYNYAHDSMGYCASVFGAGGKTTTNSIVRYNVCVNNGRSPRLAKRQGDIFLSTWDGGSLDGVQIYNNTIYWNPPIDTAALLNQAEFVGKRPNFFRNNLIYSTVPTLIRSNRSLELDHNLYWFQGRSQPKWVLGDQVFAGFDNYRSGSRQDRNSVYADPQLHDPARSGADLAGTALKLSAASPALDAGSSVDQMGSHDFFGVLIPKGRQPDIGAAEGPAPQTQPSRMPAPEIELQDLREGEYRLSECRGRWVLLSFFALEKEDQQDLSRTQSVFLRSMRYQFGEKGLQIVTVISGNQPSLSDLENLKYDWQLQEIPVLVDKEATAAARYGVDDYPATFLISPEGEILQRWKSSATAPQLGLTLRWLLGPPSGTPPADLN